MPLRGGVEPAQHEAEADEYRPIAVRFEQIAQEDDHGADDEQCNHQDRYPARALTYRSRDRRCVTR